MTGKPWNLSQMEEAIDREKHVPVLQPVEMKILAEEVAEKYKKG